MEPGPEIGPGLETAQLLIRLEKATLHHVLGVRRAPGEPVRHVEDVPRVALDERTERVAVAVAGLGDDGGASGVRSLTLFRPRRFRASSQFDAGGRPRLVGRVRDSPDGIDGTVPGRRTRDLDLETSLLWAPARPGSVPPSILGRDAGDGAGARYTTGRGMPPSRALHAFLTPRRHRPSLRSAPDRPPTTHPVQNRASCVKQGGDGARVPAAGFEVTMAGGQRFRCRKLLLATGVVDELPEIEGLEPLLRPQRFHCPYCDGWESRDQPIAVYSRSANGVGLAIELRHWSHGRRPVHRRCALDSAKQSRWLRRAAHCSGGASGLRGSKGARGQLKRIVFVDGQSLEREVMFFSTGQRQASNLAEQLGCCFTRKGAVRTGEYEMSDISGVYVAGDASRLVQLAIVAAAEGAQAAFAINTALTSKSQAPSARRAGART